MNRTQYKNRHRADHYDRMELSVPKGMKQVIKDLAAEKGMSVNAYMVSLVTKDQDGLYDTMQIAEKNRQHILNIKGNMHDGYDIFFTDGHISHQRTKKDVRNYIIRYLTEDRQSLTEDS